MPRPPPAAVAEPSGVQVPEVGFACANVATRDRCFATPSCQFHHLLPNMCPRRLIDQRAAPDIETGRFYSKRSASIGSRFDAFGPGRSRRTRPFRRAAERRVMAAGSPSAGEEPLSCGGQPVAQRDPNSPNS
jgi:hypothetical protein